MADLGSNPHPTSFTIRTKVAVEELSCGLERVREWMRLNKLKLKFNKTEVLGVSPW